MSEEDGGGDQPAPLAVWPATWPVRLTLRKLARSALGLGIRTVVGIAAEALVAPIARVLGRFCPPAAARPADVDADELPDPDRPLVERCRHLADDDLW